MAYLPYTDGSNGNGITRASELQGYLQKYPLALMDEGFMLSYVPLINTDAGAKLKSELLELSSGALWAKKLQGKELEGWEKFAEMDPRNNEDDLKTMAAVFGLPLESARKFFQGK